MGDFNFNNQTLANGPCPIMRYTMHCIDWDRLCLSPIVAVWSKLLKQTYSFAIVKVIISGRIVVLDI